MGVLIGLIGLVLMGGWLARRWMLNREVPQRQQASMNAEVFRAGEAYLARRRGAGPTHTVVVVHGFMENALYFTRYYQDPSLELIMLSNGGYHLPLSTPQFQPTPWAAPVLHTGTIVADAKVLNLALEHLVSTTNIRVHGHSRGGAVALEAARQRPDLFEGIEVVLEAPVLPQGRTYRPLSPIAGWLMPLVHLLWQRRPLSPRSLALWGPLDDPYKRELISGLPFNPRRSQVLVTNLRDMEDWMRDTGADIYRNVKRGSILVPGKDRVLQAEAMLHSARQAENLQIIEIPGGSHFVTLDNPESIPPLTRN